MNTPVLDQVKAPPAKRADPRRYFETIGEERTPVAAQDPVCLYLEVTNRCNLLCTTCPRTFEELEPPSDMSWELFTSIVEQFPKIERVVLPRVDELRRAIVERHAHAREEEPRADRGGVGRDAHFARRGRAESVRGRARA